MNDMRLDDESWGWGFRYCWFLPLAVAGNSITRLLRSSDGRRGQPFETTSFANALDSDMNLKVRPRGGYLWRGRETL